jgi:hypothetical protein
MAYFKIRNITNTLGKRDSKVNTAQNIEFKDIIGSSNVSISPGGEIVIEATYLPVSAQKLRAEGIITVVEIDRNTYQKLLNAQDARTEVAAAVQTSDSGSIKSEEKKKFHKEKTK